MLAIRPFRDLLVGFTILLNEGLTAVFYALLIVSEFSSSYSSFKNLQTYCMYVIFTALGISASVSILSTIGTIYQFIKRKFSLRAGDAQVIPTGAYDRSPNKIVQLNNS